MEVEAELSVLRRDIKLTSAPKKQAMELMRRKIEARTKPAADSARRAAAGGRKQHGSRLRACRALTGRVSTTGGQ